MFSKNKTIKIRPYIIIFFIIFLFCSQNKVLAQVDTFSLQIRDSLRNTKCFHEEFGQIDCTTGEAFRPYNENIGDLDSPRSTFWKWARGRIYLRYRPYTVTSD